jgi:hypothetical protein
MISNMALIIRYDLLKEEKIFLELTVFLEEFFPLHSSRFNILIFYFNHQTSHNKPMKKIN